MEVISRRGGWRQKVESWRERRGRLNMIWGGKRHPVSVWAESALASPGATGEETLGVNHSRHRMKARRNSKNNAFSSQTEAVCKKQNWRAY